MTANQDMPPMSADQDRSVVTGTDSTSHTDAKRASVTTNITISREDAEAMADFFTDPSERFLLGRLALICRAALDAQNDYDNSPELQALLRKAALEAEK